MKNCSNANTTFRQRHSITFVSTIGARNHYKADALVYVGRHSTS